jgi:hypothetical protein
MQFHDVAVGDEVFRADLLPIVNMLTPGSRITK